MKGPAPGAELARMGMIMGLVPAVAPVLGGVLQMAFGWRSTFIASLLFGLALGVVIVTVMPETLRARSPGRSRSSRSSGALARCCTTAPSGVYVALTALAYAGLFAFISGSSFVLIGVYGLSPVEYGFSFGFGVLGYIPGTIIAQRLVGRRGMDGVIAIGVACLAGGAASPWLVGVATGLGGPLGGRRADGALCLRRRPDHAAGPGLGDMPFPDRAGAASSFNGLCQMLLSACVGLLVGHLLKSAALPLPAVMSALGVMPAATKPRRCRQVGIGLSSQEGAPAPGA